VNSPISSPTILFSSFYFVKVLTCRTGRDSESTAIHGGTKGPSLAPGKPDLEEALALTKWNHQRIGNAGLPAARNIEGFRAQEPWSQTQTKRI